MKLFLYINFTILFLLVNINSYSQSNELDKKYTPPKNCILGVGIKEENVAKVPQEELLPGFKFNLKYNVAQISRGYLIFELEKYRIKNNSIQYGLGFSVFTDPFQKWVMYDLIDFDISPSESALDLYDLMGTSSSGASFNPCFSIVTKKYSKRSFWNDNKTIYNEFGIRSNGLTVKLTRRTEQNSYNSGYYFNGPNKAHVRNTSIIYRRGFQSVVGKGRKVTHDLSFYFGLNIITFSAFKVKEEIIDGGIVNVYTRKEIMDSVSKPLPVLGFGYSLGFLTWGKR